MFSFIFVITILSILGISTLDHDNDKDILIKKIEASGEMSDQNKIEFIADLNREFYSEVTHSFLPALTLVLGFIVGRNDHD